MCISIPVVAALLLAAQLKPEAAPAAVKETLDKYLKAVEAKDLDAMAALADVPWLDRGGQFVRDRAGLRKALEGVAGQLPRPRGERKVQTFHYKTARPGIEDKAERKLYDDALGEDGWFAYVEDDGYPLADRILLVRVKGGKATVVGGPLKVNQITPKNRIPEVVDRLFEKAETFELYSLDPDFKFAREGKDAGGKDAFHGWKVLGKTEVKGEKERQRLADALRLGAEDNFGMVAACFIPRHGIRLKGGGKTVDVVICFQCLSAEVYVDDKRDKGFLTTGDPQPAFDTVLKAAGVPLPKPAKE
jgi:hypothetical protein